MILDATSGEELDRFDDVQHVSGTGNGFFNGPVALDTTPASGGYTLTDPVRGGQFTCDMNNGKQRCHYMNDAGAATPTRSGRTPACA